MKDLVIKIKSPGCWCFHDTIKTHHRGYSRFWNLISGLCIVKLPIANLFVWIKIFLFPIKAFHSTTIVSTDAGYLATLAVTVKWFFNDDETIYIHIDIFLNSERSVIKKVYTADSRWWIEIWKIRHQINKWTEK